MSASKKGTVAASSATVAARKTAKRGMAEQLAATQTVKGLSNDTATLVTAFISHDAVRDVKRGAVLDALQADGPDTEWFLSPDGKNMKGKECPPEHVAFYAALKVAVSSGITAVTPNLTATELSLKVGSKIKDLRNGLIGRYEKAQDDGTGASERSTIESRIIRDCSKFVAQLEKATTFNGNKESAIAGLKTAIMACSPKKSKGTAKIV